MGNVTELSRQVNRTILQSISCLAPASAAFSAAANRRVEGKVSTEPPSGQGAVDQKQEFYISLSTEERDQPDLSTLVVAGSNRLMFDCGLVRGGTVPSSVSTLSDASRRDDKRRNRPGTQRRAHGTAPSYFGATRNA